MITVFTINIEMPLLLTIFVLTFEHFLFTACWCVYNSAGCVANRGDPDQMLHSAVSYQGLHCVLRPACPNI